MNKNVKGFMLLETLIVSTIILSTLVFLFIQFTNIKTSYEISFKYNTIPGIYKAKELSDFLVENGLNTSLSNQLDKEVNGFVNIKTHTYISNGNNDFYVNMLKDMNVRNIIYTSDNLTTLKEYLNGNSVDTIFTESFKNFILGLNTNESLNNRLIIMYNDDTFATIIVGGV